jgi:hypothetical protein
MRMKKVLVIALMSGVLALSGSNLYAACSAADPTPIGHFLTGFLNCADVDPLTGVTARAFIYQLNAPGTTNSGPLNTACASPAGPSLTCTGSSPGTPGDGMLTVETDAIITGWNGCPAKFTANGRLLVVVIGADGAGATLSVSGRDPNFGYFLEMAHDTTDGSDIIPITCGDASRPRVVNVSNDGTNVTIQLRIPLPTIHHDCGPNSLGKLFTDTLGATVCDGFAPAAAQGRLYTSTQPCGPADMTLTRWTASTVTPNAAGDATLVVPSPVAPSCLFVAGSNTISGSPEILNGFVQVAPQLAASPRAENVRVANAYGKVTVTWSTSTELGLATFKVLTQTKAKGELEVATAAPKGNGGAASYSVPLGMGDFKGGRTVIVRAVMTNGTFNDAAPVNF